MKKIVKSICYDTDKATIYGSFDGTSYSIDNVWMPSKGTIYRGKNGHFFVVYNQSGDQNLAPLPESWALDLCQRHGITAPDIPEVTDA